VGGVPVSGAAKRTLAAALGAVLIGAVHAWWPLAGWVALCAGVWLFRLRRHPMGPCRACKGRGGRNVGSDATQWGGCPRCEKTPGGRGEEPRFGARLVHPELRRH
jgi:hypothetical protein